MIEGSNKFSIPVFAVVGHPNEGKSSVVSTLTEDDSIKISPIPGETTSSGNYTVEIDGKQIIRFVDTPGFQAPRQTLEWFKGYQGDPARLLFTFLTRFKSDPFFADECELLAPLAWGAGIIYVVDGSRPIRENDLAEMEVLRLTGRPRMAVINSKSPGKDYVEEWRREFNKHFNGIRVFNSNTADFGERIRMLESLKAMDQTWELDLAWVIRAFRRDWERRNRLACVHITHAIKKSIGYHVSRPLSDGDTANLDVINGELLKEYPKGVRKIEQDMFDQIRGLFHHNLYRVTLPVYSVLNHDLFSRKTWDLLGLTRKQLIAAGAFMGGSLGAVADVSVHGLSFGIFTALGGVIGAGSAMLGGRRLAQVPGLGKRLGGDSYQVGPHKDPQFLYILLDRALIYYQLIIQHPHGRRDVQEERPPGKKAGKTTHLSGTQRRICAQFFNAVSKGKGAKGETKKFAALIQGLLEEISGIDD